jgi:hypothetical protein
LRLNTLGLLNMNTPLLPVAWRYSCESHAKREISHENSILPEVGNAATRPQRRGVSGNGDNFLPLKLNIHNNQGDGMSPESDLCDNYMNCIWIIDTLRACSQGAGLRGEG